MARYSPVDSTRASVASLTARDILLTLLALSLFVAVTATIITATHAAIDALLSMGYPNAFGWDIHDKL